MVQTINATSISLDAPLEVEMEDIILPDAPIQNVLEDAEDFGESDGSYDAVMNSNEVTEKPATLDVKLEDLFNDDDDDDEFSNSKSVAASNMKVESSPPPPPM